MKIHSDILTTANFYNAVKARGMIGVNVDEVRVKGSTKRARGFDLYLSGNSASRQNMRDSGEYAAQYDEWGIVLDELYRIDPALLAAMYADYEDFKAKTVNRFDTLQGGQTHRKHTWKPVEDEDGKMVGYHSVCKCGAQMSWEPRN